MSLAATTSTALTLIDSSSLKANATTSSPTVFPLSQPPIATAWTPDNSILYVASAHAIHALSTVSAQFSLVYTSPPNHPPLASALLARDNSVLAFTKQKSIHLLSTSSRPPRITASLPPHPASVVSITFSNDSTLLASASAQGVLHIYNLTHNSNAVLRSFPGAARAPCICSFDPHLRTRLFVGAGTTLAVYDTARPAAPIKTILLTQNGPSTTIGHLIAISSSPYSKNLVAVAFSTFLGLVDLDKENPLFKTVPMKAPVTSMTFTSDGASLALGTENGKVLILNLRNLERQPRIFEASNKGERVVALSVQKRNKTSSGPRISTSQSVPLVPRDLNNAVKSPLRRTASSKSPITPKVKVVRKEDRPKPKPKPAFSPPRGGEEDAPGDISVPIETLIGAHGASEAGKKQELERPRPRSRSSSSDARMKSAASGLLDVPLATRTRARSSSRGAGDMPARTLTPSDASPPRTRSPSSSATPDLPSIAETDPVSLWTNLKTSAPRDALTTPDMERWVAAGRDGGDERRMHVGWAVDGEAEAEKENVDVEKVEENGKTTSSKEVSPMRKPHLPLQLSPLRTGGNTASGPQELLRAVVKDVMYEYRQETREEIKGLHLDLLKVGRSWKSELRTMMQEYVGDLRQLREENARLRAENDRLRRGF